jgi:hypothetical protein
MLSDPRSNVPSAGEMSSGPALLSLVRSRLVPGCIVVSVWSLVLVVTTKRATSSRLRGRYNASAVGIACCLAEGDGAMQMWIK